MIIYHSFINCFENTIPHNAVSEIYEFLKDLIHCAKENNLSKKNIIDAKSKLDKIISENKEFIDKALKLSEMLNNSEYKNEAEEIKKLALKLKNL